MSELTRSVPEILTMIEEAAYKKTEKSFGQIFVSAILAGAFIAFGATGSLLASSAFIQVDVGIARFLGASVFPVGLMMVVVLAVELFTSNCLMMVAYIKKRISLTRMLSLLATIYVGNAIGAIGLALAGSKIQLLYPKAQQLLLQVANDKVHFTIEDLFIRAILCNILVCVAAMMTYAAKDVASKCLAVWFPIMLFALLGYEHSIANLFYLPSALFQQGAIDVWQIGYNLFVVTIGNWVGGAICVALPLVFIYQQKVK